MYSFEPIAQYIEQQYDDYLEQEQSQEMRKNISDTRIHALVYFLPPTGIDQ
jgi:cell division control protein 11